MKQHLLATLFSVLVLALATSSQLLAQDPVIAAAGDIVCDPGTPPSATECKQMETSNLLLLLMPDGVLPLGDNQYHAGEFMLYRDYYGPSWGRVPAARVHPVPGNHEYITPGATGYFDYFASVGVPVGDRDKGYYSFNLGAWHIIALNSSDNCAYVGGCAAGSPQELWLRADLAANRTPCTLAYWHHPRFTSGFYTPGVSDVQPLWQALYDAKADVVLNGHDHIYERFAPQTPTGQLDAALGIREFIVGTGGRSHYTINITPVANSEVRDGNTFGVLKLTLHRGSYNWQFMPISGQTFTDQGSGSCHNFASAEFSVSATPSSQTVLRGSGTSYTATVTALGGFSGVVQFGVTGLPTGANGSFSPPSVTGSGSSTLNVTTSVTTAPGSYPLTITGTSGSLSRSASVTLVVTSGPDFSVSAVPSSQTVDPGTGTSYTATVTPSGGFSGVVQFSVTGLPTGANGSFSPPSVAGSGSSTLNVTTSVTTAVGSYPLTITGTSGSLSRSAPVTLIVRTGGRPPRFAYVTSASSLTVSAYTVDASTGALTPVTGSPFATGDLPLSVAVEPTGRFAYVANVYTNNISAYNINPTTGALTPMLGSPFDCDFAADVTVDPSGKFAYVANQNLDSVSGYRIDSTTGALTPVPGSPFVAGDTSRSVAVDPTGRFAYVVNAGAGNVSAYTIDSTTGTLTPVPGSPFAAGAWPRRVAVDPRGRFAYVANPVSNNISAYNINPTTGALTQVPGSPFPAGTYPYGLALEPAGRFAYVANFDDNTVSAYSINATTGALTLVPGSPFNTDIGPYSVAVDPTGRFVYVANHFTDNVSGFTIDSSTGALTPMLNSFPAGSFPVSVTVTSGP